MAEQDGLRTRLKSEAFDRIVSKYFELDHDAGFYSQNWVELAEVIDQELQKMKWITGRKD